MRAVLFASSTTGRRCSWTMTTCNDKQPLKSTTRSTPSPWACPWPIRTPRHGGRRSRAACFDGVCRYGGDGRTLHASMVWSDTCGRYMHARSHAHDVTSYFLCFGGTMSAFTPTSVEHTPCSHEGAPDPPIQSNYVHVQSVWLPIGHHHSVRPPSSAMQASARFFMSVQYPSNVSL